MGLLQKDKEKGKIFKQRSAISTSFQEIDICKLTATRSVVDIDIINGCISIAIIYTFDSV